MKISAIIAAGGRSSRMNGKNKLTEIIGGVPLIARTTRIFDEMDEINSIIVPAAIERIDQYKQIFSSNKISNKARLIEGGSSRMESVYKGLLEIDKDTDMVLIHDAARGLVTKKIIKDCINAANEHGACCAAVALTDTLKEIDRKGFVKKTLGRERLYRVQTPQAFIYKDILKLHKKAMFRSLKVTDDAQIAEYFGYNVYLVESDYSNIKITTEIDLIIAEALLSSSDYASAHDALASTKF